MCAKAKLHNKTMLRGEEGTGEAGEHRRKGGRGGGERDSLPLVAEACMSVTAHNSNQMATLPSLTLMDIPRWELRLHVIIPREGSY